MTGRPEIFRDKSGALRTRIRAANGKILATSGQRFAKLADAKWNVGAMRRAVIGKTVVVR